DATKTSVRGIDPRHRSSASIAPLEYRPEGNAVRVAQCLERQLRLCESEFLPLVDAYRSAQGTDESSQQGCEVRCLARATPTGEDTTDIVIRNGPARPTRTDSRLQPLDGGANVLGRKVIGQ